MAMLAQYISRNFRPCLRNIRIYTYNQIPSISTSKKKKDTLVYPDDLFPKKMPAPPKTVEDFAETKNPKSWISYGYDEENYELDRHNHKVICFTLLSVLLCGGTFIVAYLPDLKEFDWIAREARLELHRREKLGLPLIDKNYIDPSKIELPSDEELGDTYHHIQRFGCILFRSLVTEDWLSIDENASTVNNLTSSEIAEAVLNRTTDNSSSSLEDEDEQLAE